MNAPVRFSHLRAYGRSPMHGHYARTAAEDDPTYAMERGTAVHAIVFKTRDVIGYPGSVRRGKEYEAFERANANAEILTMAEYEKASRMADAVLNCKLAEPLLQGTREQTLHFNWMGLGCRTTPDNRGDGFLTELKTSKTADPVQFVWHAKRMHYHAQMRFEQYGCGAHRYPVRDHWIVCVESEEPHPVTVFHVEPEVLLEGEKLLMLWAERLKGCEASASFPPYVECIVPLVWPKDEFEYEEAA